MKPSVIKSMKLWIENKCSPGDMALYNLIRDATPAVRDSISDIYPEQVQIFMEWERVGNHRFQEIYQDYR